jgi:nucleotide-binding universal stress UspA family protein
MVGAVPHSAASRAMASWNALVHAASRLREQGSEAFGAAGAGVVGQSIIEFAEAHRVDLIAMCTRGRSGLARWLLGSVADQAC